MFQACSPRFSKQQMQFYKKRVEQMFQHAYSGYLKYAYPLDELRPITCDGQDTWGSYSLTLVDALDTLVVMGNYSEFRRVANLITETMDFDKDINVSVFETNIRIVGGLLSAHLLSKKAGLVLEEGWPCSGPLLRMAEKVARKLLPAFDTHTGLPYGTVNLKHGVPAGETPVACTACTATFILEFGSLSRLTGDPVFEDTAMNALHSLYNLRSKIGLVGNHIDVQSGKWTAIDSGIGAGVDSYFEYLVKGSVLLQIPDLLPMFREYEKSIEKYLKREDWYMWANMQSGGVTLPYFQSLEAFWPGMQSLIGDIDKAMKTIHNYHQVWKQFGFTPEFYNIPKSEPQGGREGYPLRPELIESVMYLYRATRDPYLLEVGVDILESIEHNTRTRCGFATVKDVRDHRLDNRMESFFLSETTKYLYLLFDTENFIHNTGERGTHIETPSGSCIIDAGGYVFNTEAHPIDPAAVYCCSKEKHQHDLDLQNLHSNIDLLSLFDLNDDKRDMFAKVGKTLERSSAFPKADLTEEALKQEQERSKEIVQIDPKTGKVSAGEGHSKGKQELEISVLEDGTGSKLNTNSLQNVIKVLKDTLSSHQKGLSETMSQTIAKLTELQKGASDNRQAETSDNKGHFRVRDNGRDSEDEVDSIDGECSSQSSEEEVCLEKENNNKMGENFEYTAKTVPQRMFVCPAKPFYSRMSYMGEMFVVS